MLIQACLTALAAVLPGSSPSRADLIRTLVPELIKMQEDGGAWPYEGVYRVNGEIPIGYRVGGTAIVAGALLAVAPDEADAWAAVDRGLAFVLKGLDEPLMQPSTENAYDVRVWGHAYALEFLCRIRAAARAGQSEDQVAAWIAKLVETLVTEQLPDGGWNYANRRAHAAFVTAPVVQALLLARSQGETVPSDVFDRARRVLETSRTPEGAFVYSGQVREDVELDGRAKVPGSIARSPVCEATLRLLGGGSTEALQKSLDAFHEHWDELENRRRKSGTHAGKYGIAPYYFYYGHRYAAQAVELLPPERRERERARLLAVILRTRDEDGTWNDRVFPRSRNFGTAMIALALLGADSPAAPALRQATDAR